MRDRTPIESVSQAKPQRNEQLYGVALTKTIRGARISPPKVEPFLKTESTTDFMRVK